MCALFWADRYWNSNFIYNHVGITPLLRTILEFHMGLQPDIPQSGDLAIGCATPLLLFLYHTRTIQIHKTDAGQCIIMNHIGILTFVQNHFGMTISIPILEHEVEIRT